MLKIRPKSGNLLIFIVEKSTYQTVLKLGQNLLDIFSFSKFVTVVERKANDSTVGTTSKRQNREQNHTSKNLAKGNGRMS